MPILFAAIVLWGAWVVITSVEPEGWLRLAAFVALIVHPIHEQMRGFRAAFNAATRGAINQWGWGHYEGPLSHLASHVCERCEKDEALAITLESHDATMDAYRAYQAARSGRGEGE